MTTIKKIAELANVSTTTVSNVIHGKTKKVSPETIQKVESLLAEHGYVQRNGVREPAVGGSHLIAVVVNYHKDYQDSILGDPFYGRVIGFIEEIAHRMGYYLMVYSAQNIEDIFKMVMSWHVDGVVAISFSKNNCEKIYQLIQKPIVAIDAYGDFDAGQERHVVNIALDDKSGGYEMTRYLLECGYERIMICAARDSGIDHQRFLGAQEAAKRHAAPNQKITFAPLGMNVSKRIESYMWLLSRKKPRTAFFFLSDLYALEAISLYSDKGVSIPEDVGIAGFDDISFSKISVPKLTTVRQDVRQKAEMAMQVLMDEIASGQIPGQHEDELLPISLIKRKSVRVLE